MENIFKNILSLLPVIFVAASLYLIIGVYLVLKKYLASKAKYYQLKAEELERNKEK